MNFPLPLALSSNSRVRLCVCVCQKGKSRNLCLNQYSICMNKMWCDGSNCYRMLHVKFKLWSTRGANSIPLRLFKAFVVFACAWLKHKLLIYKSYYIKSIKYVYWILTNAIRLFPIQRSLWMPRCICSFRWSIVVYLCVYCMY